MWRSRFAQLFVAMWLPLLGSLPAFAQSTDIRLSVSSPAFSDGAALPQEFTCENVLEPSPPVSWSGAPPSTRSYALVLDSPERPGNVGVWWAAFNIPRDRRSFDENQLPSGTLQGVNDVGSLGYSAPCPPSNTRYTFRFTVYALDGPLQLGNGASASDVMDAMQGHILAQGQLSATYLRPSWPWG